MGFLDKIFGRSNEKQIKRMQMVVEKINSLEGELKKLSDDQLKAKTGEFKSRWQKGETLDQLLPEAFAVAREASLRVIGQRHYDVQIIGGIVLHEGKIAEMKTGEGKTLAAVLPAYLNALTGRGVHIVTVNDYLSRRDANWMGAIFHFLGISTACINHDLSYLYQPKVLDIDQVTVETENLLPVSRREAYAADIVYGTNNEFGFDYLRDNMAPSLEQYVQRELNFAIVDEVDSILIDEARTPLIISAPDNESTTMYQQFASLVPRLKEEEDYVVDEKMRSVTLTQEGISKMEKWLGIGNIYETGKIAFVHHLEQALKAHIIFKLDRDYVVKDGEVIIVDDFTGRLMPGRRYSEGLHQAIEAKEGVKVQRESRTLASITFQNYFRLYKKLAGMTGTATTSAEEFFKVYKLEVIDVPTNQPMIRKDWPDVIFKTEKAKFQAIAREIKAMHKRGVPVLAGTIAIEKSEMLSELLKKEGVPHEVLNAKNHEREAQIIANAGQKGAVTIATNMAGRGTDIKLGEGVKELGGLYIIGTERHEARRIDNQLRGRAGRQGDPGQSRFFVSLEDELMRRFGGDRLKKLMSKLGLPENQPIENKMISRSIESAQAKIEGFNFDIRKHVLEYDDVVNRQRTVIYKKRQELLKKEDIRPEIERVFIDYAEGLVAARTAIEDEDEWNTEEMAEEILSLVGQKQQLGALHAKLLEIKMSKELTLKAEKISRMKDILVDFLKRNYFVREKEISREVLRKVEKVLYLRAVDSFWMDHLEELDYLRDSIGLQGYGQKDPLIEYKREAFNLFQNLLAKIDEAFLRGLFSFQTSFFPTKPVQPIQENLHYSGGEEIGQFQTVNPKNIQQEKAKEVLKPIINSEKIGRNDPCPCGSGKKYKKCCGKK